MFLSSKSASRLATASSPALSAGTCSARRLSAGRGMTCTTCHSGPASAPAASGKRTRGISTRGCCAAPLQMMHTSSRPATPTGQYTSPGLPSAAPLNTGTHRLPGSPPRIRSTACTRRHLPLNACTRASQILQAWLSTAPSHACLSGRVCAPPCHMRPAGLPRQSLAT